MAFVLILTAFVAIGGAGALTAQEGGTSTSTPSELSTPEPALGAEGSEPLTVTVETCVEDPDSGELTCTETTETVETCVEDPDGGELTCTETAESVGVIVLLQVVPKDT